jgi:colicin import membrane protein
MQANDYFHHRAKEGNDPWLVVIGVSLLSHVLLFVFIVFFPFSSISMSHIPSSQVIEVDLAALDAETPRMPAPRQIPEPEETTADPEDYAPEVEEPEPEPEPAEAPEKPAIPVKKAPEKQFDPDDYIVEKPKPKVKQSMKKKTIQTAAVHRSAVERVKEKSRASRPRSVAERIKAMESEVAGRDRKLTDQSAKSGRGSGGRAAKDLSQIEIYQAEVAVELKSNWVFSEKLAGETQGLESRLVIKIMPDGSVTDVWYAKRSGNAYLDQSAYKTVMKADPLPPLPEGYPYYHLMLGFTPSGLSR